MGINSLWTTVKPASQKHSLMQLSLFEGYRKHHEGQRALVIGVDASIRLHQTQAVFHHSRHSQAGENPELRSLFYKLCYLLRHCILAVFVFDGPNRPAMKRDMHIVTRDHWLTERFIALIDAFGFYSHMAPGEAEAELAYLNLAGAIDVVMTDDSDVLAFGALNVIRNPNIKKDRGTVEIYTSEAIHETHSVHLTRGGIFLFALLCGGDYDKIGLPRCGAVTAQHISQTCLSDSLLNAALTMSEEELVCYRDSWQQKLCEEFTCNISGYLTRQHPDLAESVCQCDFPSVQLILSYAQPVVSPASAVPSCWSLRLPDVPKLGQLCECSFSWVSSGQLAVKFSKKLWEGVCLRSLLQPFNELNYLQNHLSNTLTSADHSKPGSEVFFSVGINVQGLITDAFASINEGHKSLKYSNTSTSSSSSSSAISSIKIQIIKIPAIILQDVIPGMCCKWASMVSLLGYNGPMLSNVHVSLAAKDHLAKAGDVTETGITFLGYIDLTSDDVVD